MIKTTKREIKLKTETIPAGTEIRLSFVTNENTHSTVLFGVPLNNPSRLYRLGFRNAKINFGSPFTKIPGLRTMERWSDDGIARSVTGKRCEPDGYGDDNSPSWLLVLGLI